MSDGHDPGTIYFALYETHVRQYASNNDSQSYSQEAHARKNNIEDPRVKKMTISTETVKFRNSQHIHDKENLGKPMRDKFGRDLKLKSHQSDVLALLHF